MHELTDRLLHGPAPTAARRERLVDAIARHGGPDDAAALLPSFLADPASNADLLDIVAVHGGSDAAPPIREAIADGDVLRPGAPSEALWALGRLGDETSERLLWNNMTGDFSVMEHACLGLLHLPCRSIRDDVVAALVRHEGAPLFPEFLPLLAVKTGDGGWAERLVDWGRSASTDCNGGLVAGVAAFGDPEPFSRVLWDPWWEIHGSGTGTGRWAYAGVLLQSRRMVDLFAEARERLDDAARPTVATFATVLWHAANRTPTGLAAEVDAESPADVLDALFGRHSPVMAVADDVLDHDDPVHESLDEARTILKWRARAELLGAG